MKESKRKEWRKAEMEFAGKVAKLRSRGDFTTWEKRYLTRIQTWALNGDRNYAGGPLWSRKIMPMGREKIEIEKVFGNWGPESLKRRKDKINRLVWPVWRGCMDTYLHTAS